MFTICSAEVVCSRFMIENVIEYEASVFGSELRFACVFSHFYTAMMIYVISAISKLPSMSPERFLFFFIFTKFNVSLIDRESMAR